MILQEPTPSEIEALNLSIDLSKKKAKAAHDIWAHWMKYMFTQCKPHTVLSVNTMTDQMESIETGNILIPKELVEKWKRLINTDFEDLTGEESNSDFEVSNKYLNEWE